MEEKKNSIEENLKEIEKIIEDLDNGELSLEESLKTFEKGVSLIRESNSLLGDVEKKLKVLTENGELNDFS